MTPFCPACESKSELKLYTTFSYYYCNKCKEDIGLVKPKPYRIGVGTKVELLKTFPHFDAIIPSGEYKTIKRIVYKPEGELFSTTYYFEEGGTSSAEMTVIAL
jgi:hypothetical protein